MFNLGQREEVNSRISHQEPQSAMDEILQVCKATRSSDHDRSESESNMNLIAFVISVKTEQSRFSYIAIARNSAEATLAAIDRFGVAGIFTKPLSMSVPESLSTPRSACAGAKLIAYDKHAI